MTEQIFMTEQADKRVPKAAARPSESSEEIIARKLRMLDMSAAIVLAPRTSEGHLLTKILFGFDRVVNRLRMSAGGTRVKISEVVDMMANVNDVMKELEKVATALGGGHTSAAYESPEAKRLLASRRNSYVFVPRTDEGQRVAYLLKSIDPQLVQLRTTCTDFSKVSEAIAGVLEVVRTLNEVTASIARRIKVKYYEPKGMEQMAEEH